MQLMHAVGDRRVWMQSAKVSRVKAMRAIAAPPAPVSAVKMVKVTPASTGAAMLSGPPLGNSPTLHAALNVVQARDDSNSGHRRG